MRCYQLRVSIGGCWFASWWKPFYGLGQWTHYPRHSVGECDVCDPWVKGEGPMKLPSIKVPEEGQQAARVEAPKLLAKLPTASDVLIQPVWDGGEVKGERAVFCFVSSTLVKLLLKIESPPLKLMVSGRSWDEAWAALEGALRADDVPWEQDTPRQQQGQKKRKGGG